MSHRMTREQRPSFDALYLRRGRESNPRTSLRRSHALPKIVKHQAKHGTGHDPRRMANTMRCSMTDTRQVSVVPVSPSRLRTPGAPRQEWRRWVEN
jgi:hypothetical protein